MLLLLNILIYGATLLFVSIYGYFWYSYKYWSKKKVPYLEPKFPYGNYRKLLAKSRGYNLQLMELYNEIRRRNWKFGGIWTLCTPVLLITDPEYTKDILTKDFHHFIDRGIYYLKTEHFSHSLFFIDETMWKNMRSHLSPTFTSGKMKMMFPLIIKTSEKLVEAIEKNVHDELDIDIREFLAKFTTDVIVSCAFGVEGNSFTDVNHPFRSIGKLIFEVPNIIGSIQNSLMNNVPDFAQKLGIPNTKKQVMTFFSNIIEETVTFRKNNNVTRGDFLQLLIDMMEKTKNTNNPFTFQQLIAQVNLFFIAGFDTSSAAMNFALYELARHEDLQDKLREEIIATLENNNDELTYEVINEMKYLHQVMEETLRIYPSVPILQRRCIKDYNLKDTDIVIEKGGYVVIPIISIHRDPEYYPDPLKFDPDRFSPENRNKINSNCYLPFGDGPRNCIGLRFGLMQSKIGLIQILKRFKLRISPGTKMPVQLDEDVFLLKTTEPIYLKAEYI